METFWDGVGYTLVFLLFFGFPIFLVLFGVFEAMTHGIYPKSAPEDQPEPAVKSDDTRAA